MVLRRCAWHRRYFGYSVVCGIASWDGWGLDFRDWMCRRCAARMRGESSYGARNGRHDRPPPARRDPLVALPPAAAMLVVAAMILVAARPLEHLPPAMTPVIEPLHRHSPPLGRPAAVPAPRPAPNEPLAGPPSMAASTAVRADRPRGTAVPVSPRRPETGDSVRQAVPVPGGAGTVRPIAALAAQAP